MLYGWIIKQFIAIWCSLIIIWRFFIYSMITFGIISFISFWRLCDVHSETNRNLLCWGTVALWAQFMYVCCSCKCRWQLLQVQLQCKRWMHTRSLRPVSWDDRWQELTESVCVIVFHWNMSRLVASSYCHAACSGCFWCEIVSALTCNSCRYLHEHQAAWWAIVKINVSVFNVNRISYEQHNGTSYLLIYSFSLTVVWSGHLQLTGLTTSDHYIG